jgi:hypothetical protein
MPENPNNIPDDGHPVLISRPVRRARGRFWNNWVTLAEDEPTAFLGASPSSNRVLRLSCGNTSNYIPPWTGTRRLPWPDGPRCLDHPPIPICFHLACGALGNSGRASGPGSQCPQAITGPDVACPPIFNRRKWGPTKGAISDPGSP